MSTASFNTPDPRPRRFARPAIVAGFVVAFVLGTGWLDGGIGVAPMRVFEQPQFLLLNALPGLLLAGLLLALTRRAVLSFGLAFLAEGLIYAVNALKVANLSTPLIPADFQMLGQLDKGGMHVLGAYLPHSPWPYLALLAGVAVVWALHRYEPPTLAARPRKPRLVGAGVMALLLATMLLGVPLWSSLYNGRRLWLEPWSATSTAAHSGLVSSLMLYHLQYGHGRHKPDTKAARQLIEEALAAQRNQPAPVAAEGGVLPDIVVVQSESFFDPRILKGMEHSHFTPNLDSLAQRGTSGALHVPTFGGGTIRTEFEVLTGLSLRYFPDLQFPYLQLNAKVVPSLVRLLRARGYETVAIHGNDPSFWNRTSAFKAIGFDRFVSQSSFPADAPDDGKYMADSAMTDEIVAQLKDKGPPQFLFAISIEAHGPYDTIPADVAARDAIPVPEGITGEDKIELQNYLYHIGHADTELGRLAAVLAHRDRPTVLLFYGDHLPALTNTFNKLGFVDGKGMLSEPGTWLLVNPSAPVKPQQASIAAWMLPGKILATAGIGNDAYFALTQWLQPQLAALTSAPNAELPTETAQTKATDKDMASVALLRMEGKLDKLLPPSDSATAGDTTAAHAGDGNGGPTMGANH